MNYKLLSYATGSAPRAGILVNDRIYDAAGATGASTPTTVLDLLTNWPESEGHLQGLADSIARGNVDQPGHPMEQVRLFSPVLYPGQIYAAGANYVDHVDEMNSKMPPPGVPTMKAIGEAPWHYIKAGRAAVLNPEESAIRPAYSSKLDWELELAVIIGKMAKNVPATRALNFVAGYTIANDLSARDAVKRDKLPAGSPFYFDFLSQKSFDGSCPLGPWMAPSAHVPDPGNLAMKLWVNGELMQDSNTRLMIFDIQEQIEMLSSRVTLFPGDIILTGTPAGVGMGRGMFLQPGDRLKLWIESIGELNHGIVAAP